MGNRLQLVLNEEVMKAVKDLRKDLGVVSNAQAIRSAVVLARNLHGYIKKGYKIHLSAEGEETMQLLIPVI